MLTPSPAPTPIYYPWGVKVPTIVHWGVLMLLTTGSVDADP